MKRSIIKTLYVLAVVAVFVVLSKSEVCAQVVIKINEIHPSDEWVELYYSGTGDDSPGSCILYLHSDDTQKVELTPEDIVNTFEVITWSGTKLNNSGDHVRLVCDTNTDTISYGDVQNPTVPAPDSGYSIGRSPDGYGNIFVLASVTQGGPNSGPPAPIPTSTPTPTPT
ncbi:hypothetical protein ACFL2C_04420, partial [Patescibacteria group bacterium]